MASHMSYSGERESIASFPQNKGACCNKSLRKIKKEEGQLRRRGGAVVHGQFEVSVQHQGTREGRPRLQTLGSLSAATRPMQHMRRTVISHAGVYPEI